MTNIQGILDELRALAEHWKTEEGDDNEIGGGYY